MFLLPIPAAPPALPATVCASLNDIIISKWVRSADQDRECLFLKHGVRAPTGPIRLRKKVCVYYCSTYYKAVRVGGVGNNGGHVLRETTSRGLCGLVCPSRTSERGEEGY